MKFPLFAAAVMVATCGAAASGLAQESRDLAVTAAGRPGAVNSTCGTTTRDLQLTPAQTVAHQVCAPRPSGYTHTNSGAAPAPPPLQVTAWVDRPNNTYAVGETVRLFVKPNKDAYITVVNVGASGASTVLFPNQFQPNNFVAANQVREIPGQGSPAQITVSGPVGSELIKVMAATRADPLVPQQNLQPAGPWQKINVSVDNWGRDLQITMNQAQRTSSSAAPRVEYDTYDKTIRTIELPAAYIPTVPQSGPNIQINVNTGPAPAMSTTTPTHPAVWGHQAAVQAPFPFTIAMHKRSYQPNEPAQLQVSSDSACLLMVNSVDTGGQRITLVSGTGQDVVQPGNPTLVSLPSVGNGQFSIEAYCSPLGASRALAVEPVPQGPGAGAVQAALTYSVGQGF
jgi:hypothetical protein